MHVFRVLFLSVQACAAYSGLTLKRLFWRSRGCWLYPQGRRFVPSCKDNLQPWLNAPGHSLSCFWFLGERRRGEPVGPLAYSLAIFSLMLPALKMTHSKFFPVIMNITFWHRAAGKERKWPYLNQTRASYLSICHRHVYLTIKIESGTHDLNWI